MRFVLCMSHQLQARWASQLPVSHSETKVSPEHYCSMQPIQLHRWYKSGKPCKATTDSDGIHFKSLLYLVTNKQT